MDGAYWSGMTDALARKTCRHDVVDAIISARAGRGFTARVADLLTPPDAQHKLAMGSVPSYGLTLAHADISGFELCPWRTVSCSATCVLSNGNGRYASVQRAWQWRTDLFANDPVSAAYRLGWELGKAVRVKGEILFRPDVNSDASWHRVLPAIGQTPGVTVYGYTKNPAVLAPTFSAPGFNYAYSWNERSKLTRVQDHLARGGAVAVVTSRGKGKPVDVDAVRAFFDVGADVDVRDADTTDEWMLTDRAVIGDLTAKGKARALIGRSGFIVSVY